MVQLTLLDFWREWWGWMKSAGIPLTPYEEKQIEGHPEVPVERFGLELYDIVDTEAGYSVEYKAQHPIMRSWGRREKEEKSMQAIPGDNRKSNDD